MFSYERTSAAYDDDDDDDGDMHPNMFSYERCSVTNYCDIQLWCAMCAVLRVPSHGFDNLVFQCG